MDIPFPSLFRLVFVTTQADVHGVGLRQTWIFAGVRRVAIRAIPCRSRVLDLGRLDLLGRFVVARHAERPDARLSQSDLPLFCRRVADSALLVRERRMYELGQQFGGVGLVRIVALHAIGSSKRLVLMRLLELRVFRIMTI